MARFPRILLDTQERDPRDSEIQLTQDRDIMNMNRLMDLYAVTRAEARVALLMAGGASTQNVASTLNVGITTVRTHLNRLFSKTDTHHQGQLVALLLAGPPRLEVEFTGTGAADGQEDWVGLDSRAA
jgi:DNA-binding CsgD family transcriptional regulator